MDPNLKSVIDWQNSVVFGPQGQQMSSMQQYPSNVNDCLAQIDSGFSNEYAKTVACNTFILANDPTILDGLAQAALTANQPRYAGWCMAKAAYLRGGCVPKTCAQVGASCGQADDGCGGTLDCGECDTGICKDNMCGDYPVDPVDPLDEYPELPKNSAECLKTVDSNMPQDMKVSTCQQLFNSKNDAATLLGFSEDAKKAGYPIASLWFYQQSERTKETSDEDKDYTTYYYIGGGVFLLIVAGIVVGSLAAK